MSPTSTANEKRVVTGKVRLSFPHLFDTYKGPDGDQDPKYSVMLLIPKEDKATVKALKAAEKKATEEGKETKWGGKMPAEVASIFHDADEDGSAEDYPERAGHYYMTVSANENRRPEIVDRNVHAIIDQSEVYSGVYAKVSVTAFAYKYGDGPRAKKGISFGLNNVQIVGGGESLGGGKRAEEEFEALSDEDEDLL